MEGDRVLVHGSSLRNVPKVLWDWPAEVLEEFELPPGNKASRIRLMDGTEIIVAVRDLQVTQNRNGTIEIM